MSCQDRQAIGQRIIDCCLREDLRGLLRRGRIGPLPESLQALWPAPLPEHWLRIDHLSLGTLWLPVQDSAPLQDWSALGDRWLFQSESGSCLEQGYRRWLEHLACGLDPDTWQRFDQYAEEADCAVSHRQLCRAAYDQQAESLAGVLEAADWSERLLGLDRLASYLDHPFYPTARAKSGLEADSLAAYAPEFAPRFQLRWLAVPRELLQHTSPPPDWWPDFARVGLEDALAESHRLLPVHPLTWGGLEALGLPEGCLPAPQAAMDVEPTLSVRTVVCVEQPDQHLKLPLAVRTLGACNLRLIKPSTLYDGHWFQRLLEALAAGDPELGRRYIHVDEQHGGHVGELKHLAYILRRYPESVTATTPVPVAALGSVLPDGRLLVSALAERFHDGDLLAWWREYLQLLLQVHLRLWLVYGIALEANQQNAVLLFSPDQPLRLLMKDNDAARLWAPRLRQARPDLAERLGEVRDARILVEMPRPLAEMFCTITLQLNLVAPLEAMAAAGLAPREQLYGELRQALSGCLDALEAEGIAVDEARGFLLEQPRLPVKYLLSAGSLFSKAQSGAADINKFYGYSARNFLQVPA